MRVDYVMSEYDPTDKEVKNKRIKSDSAFGISDMHNFGFGQKNGNAHL